MKRARLSGVSFPVAVMENFTSVVFWQYKNYRESQEFIVTP